MAYYTFTVPGKLPGLNDYLKAERSFSKNHNVGNNMKQQYQMLIINQIRLQLKRLHITKPIMISYKYYEPNRKRDLDNIAGVAHKFIQDSLVKAGVIDNDGWSNIKSFRDTFEVDTRKPRIEVTLTEVSSEYDG